ncbi:MAG: hypothetical protein C6W57_06795 [Caldibacillus debilis]|nr:MAG: hypothetical protein C6W57_06795 [Caldibacillus debilis]
MTQSPAPPPALLALPDWARDRRTNEGFAPSFGFGRHQRYAAGHGRTKDSLLSSLRQREGREAAAFRSLCPLLQPGRSAKKNTAGQP